jgi:FtsP/CotA-like multicopper oxidase with cupredoxin domain
MNRRNFLKAATGLLAGGTAAGVLPHTALGADPYAGFVADDVQRFALKIGMVLVELAPGIVLKTWGYNGVAPGPMLRVREGHPVQIAMGCEIHPSEMVRWKRLAR